MLPSWYNHTDTTILMILSWCHHIKKQNHYCFALPTQCFCLDATFPMPYCWIKRNGSQYYITCICFFGKAGKMNKHVVRRKFQNHWEEEMISTISMYKHYHQNATILMLPSCHNPKLPSQCYCPKTTVPKLSSWCYCLNAYIQRYPDPTMPTLPSKCHHLHATLMMLLSQRYHPNATITRLMY